MNERYRLIGSTASPYAIKLRALMRYRRIPVRLGHHDQGAAATDQTFAAALDAEHRPALRPVLERTGCWQYLSG